MRLFSTAENRKTTFRSFFSQIFPNCILDYLLPRPFLALQALTFQFLTDTHTHLKSISLLHSANFFCILLRPRSGIVSGTIKNVNFYLLTANKMSVTVSCWQKTRESQIRGDGLYCSTASFFLLPKSHGVAEGPQVEAEHTVES